jgi:hypothetical protein
MLNFNNFEYSKVTVPTNADEKKLFLESLKQKFINEIKESETCRNYLSKYSPDSVEKFINYYAGAKSGLIELFDYYMRIYNENDNEEYLQNAQEVLNCVLQKKLFDLQLQWRAGQINIPEIQNSFDFDFWGKNIEYCPFIPPITRNELELMKKFLQQSYYRDLEHETHWQFYIHVMEKDEDGLFPNIPDWYEFYDAMFGTGQLLLLTDKRGLKEDYYIKIAQDANAKEIEESNKKNPPPPYAPTIFTWHKDVLEFVSQCENDPYFKELFKIWDNSNYPTYKDKEYERELVDRSIRILETADRPITLSGTEVWHKAIVDAAERYVTDRTLEVLDSVYEEYITLADLGITKRYTPEEEKEARERTHYLKGFPEMILKGRELCGEPRNFDIYEL